MQSNHVRFLLPLLAALATSYSLVQSMVNPALEPLRVEFGATSSQITWVLIGFLLASAVATPVIGRLGDQLGNGRVIVATTAAIAAGSVICALAPTVTILIVGRAVQGIGGATLPLAFGLLRESLPPHKVSAAVGAIAALTAVGGGLGVLVTGPVISHLGIDWLFWLPAAINSAVAVALYAGVPRNPGHGRSVNWAAAAAMSAFLICLLLVLSLGQEWGWASGRTLGVLAASVVLATAWVLLELRSTAPIIDMRIMRERPVWTANIASFLFGVSLYSAFGFIPAFAQIPTSSGYGLGNSIATSGALFAPMTVTMLIAGLAAGRLTQRYTPHHLVAVTSLLPVLGFASLALLHDHSWQVAVATAVAGLGFGIALSALSTLVVNAVPPSQTGAATGMNANVRTIGGAAGAAVIGAVLTAHHSGGYPTERGYVLTFLGLAATSLVGAAVALTIRPRTPDTDAESSSGDHSAPSTVGADSATE